MTHNATLHLTEVNPSSLFIYSDMSILVQGVIKGQSRIFLVWRTTRWLTNTSSNRFDWVTANNKWRHPGFIGPRISLAVTESILLPPGGGLHRKWRLNLWFKGTKQQPEQAFISHHPDAAALVMTRSNICSEKTYLRPSRRVSAAVSSWQPPNQSCVRTRALSPRWVSQNVFIWQNSCSKKQLTWTYDPPWA